MFLVHASGRNWTCLADQNATMSGEKDYPVLAMADPGQDTQSESGHLLYSYFLLGMQ